MGKYYAVRKGLKVGIFETWDECKKLVIGYKGAIYKSFPTRSEAEKFLNGELTYNSNKKNIKERKNDKNNIESPPLTGKITFKRKATSPPPSSSEELEKLLSAKIEAYQEKQDNKAVAYVDGSYNDFTKEYSYGAVIFHKGKEHRFNQKFNHPSLSSMRNVAGEIEGSKKAISFCAEHGIKALEIYYDYEGIAKWALGQWRTNKPGTIAYKKFYDDMVKKHQLSVKFLKVKAHSNNKYNDLADQLAKEAVFGRSFDSSSSTTKRRKFSK